MGLFKFNALLACVRKPYFGLIPMFTPSTDLSWIPDLGTAGFMSPAFSSQAPTGIVVSPGNTWTFTSPPQWLIYNGQVLKANTDFTVSGNTATTSTTLNAGDEIYALL